MPIIPLNAAEHYAFMQLVQAEVDLIANVPNNPT